MLNSTYKEFSIKCYVAQPGNIIHRHAARRHLSEPIFSETDKKARVCKSKRVDFLSVSPSRGEHRTAICCLGEQEVQLDSLNHPTVK